jgi:hypothetical protein
MSSFASKTSRLLALLSFGALVGTTNLAVSDAEEMGITWDARTKICNDLAAKQQRGGRLSSFEQRQWNELKCQDLFNGGASQ